MSEWWDPYEHPFTHTSCCLLLLLSVKDSTQDQSFFGLSALGYLLRGRELVMVMLVCGIFIRVWCDTPHSDLFDVFLLIWLSLGHTEKPNTLLLRLSTYSHIAFDSGSVPWLRWICQVTCCNVILSFVVTLHKEVTTCFRVLVSFQVDVFLEIFSYVAKAVLNSFS